MRFYFLHRFLSVLLLLAALTCAAQGSNLRARRSVWDNIGNTLNNIGRTIKDAVRNKIESIFHPSATTEEPEITTPILESDANEMEETYRNIINAPFRCPPDYELDRRTKRCRLQTRRR